MPALFAVIDAATIASLNNGDERTLEQIFRTHYDVLLERAGERLKDEQAAAPRLLAATVRAFWDERAGFHSSAEIESFFNEEFRQRARAVRSRMAAVKRFDASEGVTAHAAHVAPTVDQLWTEIAAALHAPVVDPVTAAKQRREHAAHGAAEHIAHASEPRSWRTALIVGTIGAIVLLVGYLWADKASNKSAITEQLGVGEKRAIETRMGQLASVPLPDSSTARLGAETKLVIVPRFGKEYRAASTSGTALITVWPGNPLALEVRLGDASVQTDSGEFAVRAYADESVRYVRANTDGVNVKTPGSERTLKSGETIVIERDGSLRDANENEAAQAFGWIGGNLVLRDATVAETVHQIWRWYGMDIAVKDSAALGRRLSIEVPLASSKAAIAAIEGGAGLHFAWVKNRMTFSDAAAVGAKK